ncbi:N-acetylglucosamine-6-phosphate deacetylase [Brevibacillus ruminantium]|uniref:N-acetylglucosamine-6-phosphate deacetylase n=1 Tax=Brevibacillus ruminantium TaxID=2950604 RepID=A0ABY4WJM6_9BACL|nr:N-acetylglucosamine-6-phosphate deacetylase [Brevibacillus ruminantium]USG66991.1 N-acetylglucosamine-6-phosphate deacetylase [Brevibacillus ruminantium]
MTKRFALRGRVVANGHDILDGLVVVNGAAIEYAGPAEGYGKEWPEQVERVENGFICPGFVDMHMHGIAGSDTMDGTPRALQTISRALAGYGVTSFLATTMTAPYADLEKAIRNVVEVFRKGTDGASIVGIHLEGPWINPRYKGAQKEENIVPPALEDVRRLWELADGLIKVVTIAPEQTGALEAIRWLKDQGVVVSAGHSGASFAQTESAVRSGVRHFTHCFNAMTGMHHREPGVAGAAMYHEQLSTELIADGVHVHPAVMRILYRIKSASRLVLVSDSMRAAALGEGVYDLGGQEVKVQGAEAQLADGTLAGSILTLNHAVQNMVTLSGVPLAEAVAMATETPAEILGIGGRKGRLQAGYDADLIVFGDDYQVRSTYVGGRLVYHV